MATIGELAVNVVANTGGLDRGLAKARGSLGSFNSSIGASIGSFAKFTAGAVAAAGALIGIGSAAAAVTMGVRLAAEAEQTQVAFEVMLGSAEKAKAMIADLKDFAAATPFTFPGLTSAAQTLLGFGIAAEEVMGNVSMLSDVAAGNEQKLGNLAVVFGQIAAAGRLTGGDVLQLINAGFNPLQQIAGKTGESMSDLKKRMEAGKVSFDEVRQAFVEVTSEGGRFYGMNQKQSRTLGGLWSTFQDGISATVLQFGQLISEGGDFKGLIADISGLFEDFSEAMTKASPELKDAFAALGLAVRELVVEVGGFEEPVSAFEAGLKGVAFVFEKIAQTVELIKNSLLTSKAIAITMGDMLTGGAMFGAEARDARSEAAAGWMRSDVATRTAGSSSAAAGAAGSIGGSTRSTLTDQDAAFDEFKKWAKDNAKKLAKEFESPLESFERQWTDLRILLDDGAISQELYNRAFEDLQKDLRESDPIWKDAQRVIEATRTPLEKLNIELGNLNQLAAEGAINEETLNRARAAAMKGFRESDDPRQKREAELRDRAKELNEEFKSPLERFREGIAELFALSQRGLITPEAFKQRRKELFEDAQDGMGKPEEQKFAGAMLAGSQEAFSAILKSGAQDKQMAEQQKQTGHLANIERQMLDFLNRQPTAAPAF